MKCLIVFYSQNGTTQKVSEAITGGLSRAGYEVETHNLKDGEPPNISGFDLLGIGTPVYYYRLPIKVLTYIANLPNLNGLPVFAFLLCGSYPFEASSKIKSALFAKGATEAGSFQCYGAGYFLGYLKQGFLFSADHPNEEELARAASFGSEIGTKVYRPFENGKPPTIIYRLERFFTSPWLIKNVYSRMFRTTKECNACGLCIKECPTKNILKDKNGRPKWGRDCELCLTCEMKCPQDAILSAGSLPIFLPFLKYNVHNASLDRELDYAKVIHQHGKTKRSPNR